MYYIALTNSPSRLLSQGLSFTLVKMATVKGVVKSKVLFDYTKPELHGYLYKQGALHKAFKKRYFVLYPGYLVYYTDEAKYLADVAKGSLQVKHV